MTTLASGQVKVHQAPIHNGKEQVDIVNDLFLPVLLCQRSPQYT